MGLESRDYVRSDSRGGGGGFGPTGGSSTIKTIIVASIVVFLAQVLTITTVPHPNPGLAAEGYGVRTSLVTEWLALDWPSLRHGQVWRIVTYAFCHDTGYIWHIVFNMLVLYFFGRSVEAILGPKEFLRFYLVAAAASGLAYVLLGLVTRNIGSVLGASGAVMAVFAYYALTYPRNRVYIMGVLPIEARWLLVAYVVMDMMPVLRSLQGGQVTTGIAHSAHLGGLAFGLWYKWSGTNIASWLGAFSGLKFPSRPRSNPNVRLYDPSTETDDDLERRVDELLDKIREQGEASLTDAEREFLKEASRQYRNR